MQDFIFSLEVTMPIFLLMALGWLLKQRGMLTEEFVTVANQFNFKITLPFMLFRDIAAVNIKETFDIRFVAFCALASSICFWGIWGMARLFVKDASIRGAFVQASFRSSAAVMGLAFIENIYGSSVMGPLMIIGAVPLYNIYSVIVLAYEGDSGGQQETAGKLKQTIVNILKNPIIISIFLGLIVSCAGITFPIIFNKTVNSVAQMATPLALVTMGAGFEGRKALAKIRPTLWASAIKLLIQPLIFIPIAAMLGYAGEKMIGILIMLAAPATPSCYIMAKNMNNDGTLTASVVVATTLLAAFTLTGWIYLLKVLNLI